MRTNRFTAPVLAVAGLGVLLVVSAHAGTAQFSGAATDIVPLETWGTEVVAVDCGYELSGGGDAMVDPTQPVSVVTGGVIPTLPDYGTMTFELFEPVAAVTVGSVWMEIQVDTPDFIDQAVVVAGLGHGVVALEVWDGDRVAKVQELSSSVCCATGLRVSLDTTSIAVFADSGAGYQQALQIDWAATGITSTPANDWIAWTTVRNGSDTCVVVDDVIWVGGPGVPDVNGPGCDATTCCAGIGSEGEGEGEGEGEAECAHSAFMHMNAAFEHMRYRCATEGWENWATPEQMKFCSYPDTDLDDDGIPEQYAFALLARARCENPAIEAAFQANVDAYIAGAGERAAETDGMAGFATMSQNAITWLWTHCWMNGYAFGPYVPGKTAEEPLSATGDYDGDGLTNLQEYEAVISVGGDPDLYAEAASNSSPFWEGNPALPAVGLLGLGILLGGVAAGAFAAVRRGK